MKSLGSPILGDTLYKGESADRTYLHAYALKFNYQQENIELLCKPKVGEFFALTATQDLLSNLSLPWTLTWPNYSHPH